MHVKNALEKSGAAGSGMLGVGRSCWSWVVRVMGRRVHNRNVLRLSGGHRSHLKNAGRNTKGNAKKHSSIAIALAALGVVVLLILGILGILGARVIHAGAPAMPLPNDAYIWQRSWTPAVSAALRETGTLVRTWHVLAAEYMPDARAQGMYRASSVSSAGSAGHTSNSPNSANGNNPFRTDHIDHPDDTGHTDRTNHTDDTDHTSQWAAATPDWAALEALHAPIVAVFRIDGSIARWDDATLAAQIRARLADWRAHGLAVRGVEIDYDCASARLAAYRRFLLVLRQALGLDVTLSITALPTWMNSADLDALLATSDEAVLQLHAVLNPAQGLFDAPRARRWMDAFARRTRHAWRIALPAYGTRVTWNDAGRIVAIESESPALYPGGSAHELVAPPQTIAAFVADTGRAPPRGLAGIVWFRLPTSADVRAWSLTTWRAVLGRRPLIARLTASATPGELPGLYDVRLASEGNADALLPDAVRVAQPCLAADGLNGYALDYDSRGLLLRRTQPGLLRAGTQRTIGWLRCEGLSSATGVTLHVQP